MLVKAFLTFNQLLLVFLMSTFAHAQSNSADQLGFPVEKNNIRILPQRFEYNLIDANRFQIGNLLIQATDIGIRVQTDKPSLEQKFVFYWPLDLLEFGEILIKDSSGKGLWSKSISRSQIQIKKSPSGTRLATFEYDVDDPELLQKIQRSPFFRFCAQRQDPQTKIYFCSKDLYLNKKSKLLGILSRNSQRPESFVEINGRLVGPQGFVYLNSSKDPLALRALMLSGSTLEIDTRMKDIRFQDVVLSEDEKTIIVSAQSQEAKENVTGQDPEIWTTSLDVERPSLYLKGEGNIPLKQEFLIEGPVRKENVKVLIESSAPTNISSSELNLDLSANPTLQLQADKNSTLEKTGDDRYSWTLKDLRRNDNNRRFLKVTDTAKNPAETFWAAYDVKRNSGYEALVHLLAPLRADLQLAWIANPRYQIAVRYDVQLAKKPSFENANILSLEAFYKLPAATHMVDPNYRLGIFVDTFSSDNLKLTSYGALLSAQFKNIDVLGETIPWTMLDLRAPLASVDSSYAIAGSFEAQAAVRLPVNLDRFHELGLKYRSLMFEKNKIESHFQESYAFYGFGILF